HHHYRRHRHDDAEIIYHIFSKLLIQVFLLSHIVDHQTVDPDLLIDPADHHLLIDGLIAAADKVTVKVHVRIIHGLHIRERNERYQVIHIKSMFRQTQSTVPEELGPEYQGMHQDIPGFAQRLGVIPSEKRIFRKRVHIAHHSLFLCSHFLVHIVADQHIQ